MTIEFHCPACGKFLRTLDDKAGAQAPCPDCGTLVVVPGPSDAPVFPAGESPPPLPDGLVQPRPRSELRPCPMCGEQIVSTAPRCRFCGEVFQAESPAGRRPRIEPHRGGLVLTFGLLGFGTIMCCLMIGFPIASIIIASEDLRKMEQGRMDPEGRSLTRAGRIVAIVSICLYLAGIIAYFGFIAFMIYMENANRP